MQDNTSSISHEWPEEVLIDFVLTAATAVHKQLGPGLLEAAYQAALMIEFEERRIKAKAQVPVNATYHGRDLGLGYRADIIVDDRLLLELKVADSIADIHIAQVISYLKLLGFKRGYILNFGARMMRDGIKRISL